MPNDVKAAIDSFVDAQMPEIWRIASYIHENPELGYEEFKACQVQCDYLRAQGFDVQQGVEDLETAFIATYGSGSPVIGICSEYDALADIGHGCGHNLISTTSILTGAAVKDYLVANGGSGTVKVIGTPAEEGGGGKIQLLEKGVFDDVDTVWMMHPTSDLTRIAGACRSTVSLKITFHGKAAHAASHPDQGRNALSAANVFMAASAFWRQSFKSDMRMCMIITNGGEQANTMPDTVDLRGDVRALSPASAHWLAEKMKACAEHCALAMDCTATVEMSEGYWGRIPNETLSDVCKAEFKELGEPMLPGMPDDFGGEDLGNVSRRIPICSPYTTIFADHKISGHTVQFRELAGGEPGRRCIEVSSKAMARSIVDLLQDPSIIDRAKQELDERLAKEKQEEAHM